MIIKRITDKLLAGNWRSFVLELFLIVLGVLIALQVDNWNEARKETALMHEYLARMVLDLQRDITEFERISEAAEVRLAAGLRIRELLLGAKPTNDDYTEMLRMLRRAGFTARPRISDYTFETLKSSGNLNLITDPDLRDAILSYYGYLEGRKQYNYIIEDNQLNYQKGLDEVMTMQQRDRFFARESEEVNVEEGAELLMRAIASEDYQRSLPGSIINNRNFLGDSQRGRERAVELIQLIKPANQ